MRSTSLDCFRQRDLEEDDEREGGIDCVRVEFALELELLTVWQSACSTDAVAVFAVDVVDILIVFFVRAMIAY